MRCRLLASTTPNFDGTPPALIETLQLRPAPVARELIQAVEVLREMNRDGLRKVPQHAPLGLHSEALGSLCAQS